MPAKLGKTILEQLKKKLREEKKLLEEELSSFTKKDAKNPGNYKTNFPDYGSSPSQDENTDEVEKYVSTLPVEHTLEAKLQAVNDALTRIQRGGYGICDTCKKLISRERLLASLVAKTCMDCEQNK